MRARLLTVLCIATAAACATPGPAPLASSIPRGQERHELVSWARALVGRSHVRFAGVRDDCTGLVRGLYARLGIALLSDAVPGDNGVRAIYRYVRRHGRLFHAGRPAPGDLVFFRDTYDQNHDGQRDDGLTHVALVEGVEDDGTVLIIHRVRSGIVRYRMNLNAPDRWRDARTGRTLNDYLRAGSGSRRSLALTGQLFVAFGSVLPLDCSNLTDDHLPYLRPEPDGSAI